ncbi:MAG: LysR substrate-binding domain-containing protein, partial [Petrotogales bacterium]
DCGFIGYPVKQRNIICKKIYDQTIVLAGTKEIEDFKPENIYDIPIILQQKGSGLRRFVMEQLKKMGIDTDKINTPIEAGYEEFGKQASLKGFGYTFIPEEDTKPPLRIIWNHEYLTRSFWLITKKEEISEKITKMLRKILRGDYSGEDN